jgi:transposase
MTLNKGEQVEVVTSVQRRRRWAAAEKRAMVQETYQQGMSVSAVARTHGIAPNQLFNWRRRMEGGALTAMAGADNVVPERQLRELAQSLLVGVSESELQYLRRGVTMWTATTEFTGKRWVSP